MTALRGKMKKKNKITSITPDYKRDQRENNRNGRKRVIKKLSKNRKESIIKKYKSKTKGTLTGIYQFIQNRL